MKTPVRTNRTMNKDSLMEKKALEAAIATLAKYNANPSSAEARPKGTRPAAPWAIAAGANISLSTLRKKLDAVNAKIARDTKNASTTKKK